MPEISLAEEQLDRLDDVAADLESAYLGPYGHIRRRDAVEYLLDTYTPPEAADVGTTGADEEASSPGPDPPNDGADAAGDASSTRAAESAGTGAASGSGTTAGGDSPLRAAAALLEDNADRWRESSGDAPYEVDLPDGSTEAVRTKGDVKRLLFKHYR